MPPASASPARSALPAASAAGPKAEKIPAPTIEPSPMTTASPVPSLRAREPVIPSRLRSARRLRRAPHRRRSGARLPRSAASSRRPRPSRAAAAGTRRGSARRRRPSDTGEREPPRQGRGSHSRPGPRRRRIPAPGRAAGHGTSRRGRGSRARPSPAGCRRRAREASSCRPTRPATSSCRRRWRRAARLPRRAVAALGSGARRGRAGRAARGRAGSWCSSLLLFLGIGDSVQDEPDDPGPRLLRRPPVPAAQMGVGPRDGVEREVGGVRGVLVGQRQRSVLRALAEKVDERVEVRRRPTGGRLVEGLVGGQEQREVALDDLAQRLEPAGEPIAARASDGQNGVHRRAEVVGEGAEEGLDERLAAEPLAPERRSRPARGLRNALERQSVPPVLTKHLDGGAANALVQLDRHCFRHATQLLHRSNASVAVASRKNTNMSVPRSCLLALALAAAVTAPGEARTSPTLEQLLGQKLVVTMDGKTPSASLLSRARRGQIGGVIIHSWNFTSTESLRSVTSRLQQAAAAGGRPPLLVGVDQEGGPVKTISWIPPSISPRQLGALHSGTRAERQGQATGRALRSLGVNVDFAPIADVPGSPSSFLYRQGRTWSFAWHTTARMSGWFAIGLGQSGVIASAKHFPGLGLAARDTDRNVVRITAARAELASGLKPFRTAIADRVPLIMLSNALYTAYDGGSSAGWSRAIGTKLLRKRLGFGGATITDSLDGAADARHVSTAGLATRAAQAGTDLLLLTGSERASQSVYRSLLQAAGSGRIDHARLLGSYERILTLKTILRTRTARTHA